MNKLAVALLGLSILSGCVEDGSTPITAANSRVFKITNQTGVTLTNFQASSSSDDNWGNDRFGQSVLKTGTFRNMNFNDGNSDCFYDFKAEFADGDEVIRNKINICEETGLTYF